MAPATASRILAACVALSACVHPAGGGNSAARTDALLERTAWQIGSDDFDIFYCLAERSRVSQPFESCVAASLAACPARPEGAERTRTDCLVDHARAWRRLIDSGNSNGLRLPAWADQRARWRAAAAGRCGVAAAASGRFEDEVWLTCFIGAAGARVIEHEMDNFPPGWARSPDDLLEADRAGRPD